jgi:hypothetical protein
VTRATALSIRAGLAYAPERCARHVALAGFQQQPFDQGFGTAAEVQQQAGTRQATVSPPHQPRASPHIAAAPTMA